MYQNALMPRSFETARRWDRIALRKDAREGVMGIVDPKTYRRRLAVAGAILTPLLLAIFGWHAWDARRQGEPPWVVVVGAALAVAVIGGTVFYATRDGPAGVAARTRRLAKWLVPLAVAVAALRAVAWALHLF
jgi:hypothetical protein